MLELFHQKLNRQLYVWGLFKRKKMDLDFRVGILLIQKDREMILILIHPDI